MHKSKRKSKGKKGYAKDSVDNKTAVTAYLERGGNIRFDVVDAGETEKGLVINSNLNPERSVQRTQIKV